MLARTIQLPLLDGDSLPRWKLSYLARELYQQQERKELHARIWDVLHHSGLHPLVEVEKNLIDNEDWKQLDKVWSKMFQDQKNERTILRQLTKKR